MNDELNATLDNVDDLNATLTNEEVLNAQFGVVSETEVEVEVPVYLEGTDNYEELKNKPKINAVTLVGDKSFEQLGLQKITNREIEAMFN